MQSRGAGKRREEQGRAVYRREGYGYRTVLLQYSYPTAPRVHHRTTPVYTAALVPHSTAAVYSDGSLGSNLGFYLGSDPWASLLLLILFNSVRWISASFPDRL